MFGAVARKAAPFCMATRLGSVLKFFMISVVKTLNQERENAEIRNRFGQCRFAYAERL
jgi:hypothetical protein